MKTIWISMVTVAMLLAHPLFGQTDATALESALKAKPLGLRSYSADQAAKYTWFGDKLVPRPVELHGIRAFFTDSVQKKGSKIVIEGQSSTLVRVGPRLAPMGKVPARLEIDLQGADAAAVFPKLQEAVFFPSLSVALQNLPDNVSDMLPFPSEGKFQSACHCSHVLQEGKWVKVDGGSTTLTAPTPVKADDTSGLDQKGIDAKASGTVTLVFSVSEFGRVDEVWVAKPLGSGLDEAAAKLVRESTFNPATLDGKPVGAVLMRTLSVN
jgi:TonB family protein